MEIRELLDRLDRHRGSFPEALLNEAIVRRDEIIPELLGILEDIDLHPEIWREDESRFIHIHAVYLLAFFREKRAYPVIVRIFARPGEFPFEVFGDVTTQSLSPILASVCGGNLSGIKRLIEDEEVNEWVRSCALSALVSLVAVGQSDRAEIIRYAAGLFGTLERNPSAVWDGLAYLCADLWPQEALEPLRLAYEEELVAEDVMGWDEIDEALALGKEEALKRYASHKSLVIDLAASMGWMTAFQPPEDFDKPDDDFADDADDLEDAFVDEILDQILDGTLPRIGESSSSTEHRVLPGPRLSKVGRNERCPCGSGKKYKKCCGVN